MRYYVNLAILRYIVHFPAHQENNEMQYAMPGSKDALYTFKSRYENYIGGEWTPPLEGS